MHNNIPSQTTKLAAFERLKNQFNVKNTLAPSFLVGSS